MFNLITSASKSGGNASFRDRKNDHHQQQQQQQQRALVSSHKKDSGDDVEVVPRTTATTTTANVFDSIRGDVNLELRTTQTWGLGLSSRGPRGTFGGQSSSMCSIKDAAEKLEQDRKKARQELLLMSRKLEEHEKKEKTTTRSLESEREMTAKLRASLTSANRKIGDLMKKVEDVEDAHAEYATDYFARRRRRRRATRI